MFDDKMKEDHRQAIEENDATIALLNDDLKNREYENVDLQSEIRAQDQQITALKDVTWDLLQMKTKAME